MNTYNTPISPTKNKPVKWIGLKESDWPKDTQLGFHGIYQDEKKVVFIKFSTGYLYMPMIEELVKI